MINFLGPRPQNNCYPCNRPGKALHRTRLQTQKSDLQRWKRPPCEEGQTESCPEELTDPGWDFVVSTGSAQKEQCEWPSVQRHSSRSEKQAASNKESLRSKYIQSQLEKRQDLSYKVLPGKEMASLSPSEVLLPEVDFLDFRKVGMDWIW